MIGELYDGEFENFTRDDGLLCSDCKYNVGDGCRLVFEECQYEKVSDECPNDNNVSTKNTVSRETFEQVMWERDIAISQLKELGYGFGEKIEPCDDAISRKIISAFSSGLISDEIERKKALQYVNELSAVNPKRCDDCIWSVCNYNKVDWESVTPKPKTGHWILKRTFPTKLYDEYLNEYKCSECYRGIRCTDSQLVNYPFCHCGARMVEPQERSDKK